MLYIEQLIHLTQKQNNTSLKLCWRPLYSLPSFALPSSKYMYAMFNSLTNFMHNGVKKHLCTWRALKLWSMPLSHSTEYCAQIWRKKTKYTAPYSLHMKHYIIARIAKINWVFWIRACLFNYSTTSLLMILLVRCLPSCPLYCYIHYTVSVKG